MFLLFVLALFTAMYFISASFHNTTLMVSSYIVLSIVCIIIRLIRARKKQYQILSDFNQLHEKYDNLVKLYQSTYPNGPVYSHDISPIGCLGMILGAFIGDVGTVIESATGCVRKVNSSEGEQKNLENRIIAAEVKLKEYQRSFKVQNVNLFIFIIIVIAAAGYSCLVIGEIIPSIFF